MSAQENKRRNFTLLDTESRSEKLPDWRNSVYVGVKPYRQRLAQLDRIAQGLRPQWQILRDFFAPHRGRQLESGFTGDGQYRIHYKNNPKDNILNGSIHTILKTCVAGLEYSFTSPQNPWFSFADSRPELNNDINVRRWLDGTKDVVMDAMGGSNFYTSNSEIYYETAVFGAGINIVDADVETKINCIPLTIGEFVIDEDHRHKVDTCYYLIEMTARQIKEKFGEDNEAYTDDLKNAIDNPERFDDSFTVIRAMQPLGTFGKPPVSVSEEWKYESCYFLRDGSNRDDEKVLSWEMHRSCPFVCMRWGRNPNNPYGYSPAMEVLNDQRMIQLLTKYYIQGVEYELHPPVVGDADTVKQIGMYGRIDPGAAFVEGITQQKGLRPLYQIQPNFNEYRILREDLLKIIRDAYYYDQWRALEQITRQMTAFETDARLREKIAQLAPLIERFEVDGFEAYITRVYTICNYDLGLILDPPEAMNGGEIRIEYEGDYSKTIKLIEVERASNYITQTVTTANGIAGLVPDQAISMLNTIDFTKASNFFSKRFGIEPEIMRSQEELDKLNEQARLAAQQQQEMAGLKEGAGIAKDVSGIPMDDGNALQMLMGGAHG